MNRRTLATLALLWTALPMRAAEPTCAAPSLWRLEAVEDLDGPLRGEAALRLAIVYRPVLDPVTLRWTMVPVLARPGMRLCPGDRLETWQGARSTVLLEASLYSPLASVAGEGGSVLEFNAGVVQRRGTASYLIPDGGPGLSVRAPLGDDQYLSALDQRSAFELSVSDGCSPEVDVSVRRCDPWDDPTDPRCTGDSASEHAVTLQVVDAAGRPKGDPVVLRGGEVGGLPRGERHPRRYEEREPRSREARDRLQPASAARHDALASREQPPAPAEWPALTVEVDLLYLGEARPHRVEVDGQLWSPGTWWRERDAQGTRYWRASRSLGLSAGAHQVVVWEDDEIAGDRAVETSALVASGRQAVEVPAGERVRREVAAPITTPPPSPVLPPRAAPATTSLPAEVGKVGDPPIGGPTGRTMVAREGTEAEIPFIELSAGEFDMGSPDGQGETDEHPQHRVRLTRALWVAEHETTQAEWAAVVRAAQAAGDSDAASLKPDPSFFKGATLPVERVSWCDAVRFANALSRLEGLVPAYTVGADCSTTWDAAATGYRLPTEAEWEYAARAGTTTDYSFGDEPDKLCANANVFDKDSKAARSDWTWDHADCSDGHAETAPVCSFARNPWGLCDLHGNVWEWAWDGYQTSYYADSPAADPAGPAEAGDGRVLRGGAWLSAPDWARAAFRYRNTPSGAGDYVGFRLVRPVLASEPGLTPGP